MKPREFDELIRQKFDQGDFEYNPRNWDKLADELDGRAKKRNVIMWWLMPLAGVAASVALAMGVPGLFRNIEPSSPVAKVATVHERTYASIESAPGSEPAIAHAAMIYDAPAARKQHVKQKKQLPATATRNIKTTVKTEVAVNETTTADVTNNSALPGRTVNLLSIGNISSKNKDSKKAIVAAQGYNTFKPEVMDEVKKAAPKLSVILSGGINKGAQNNGYMAGATIRRMVSDKVFFEGDVAFASGSNSQSRRDEVQVPVSNGATKTSAGKTSSPDAAKSIAAPQFTTVTKDYNVSYAVSYAQVTPSIGYKIMKKMSIAAGPDFQQMLADNRPAQSTTDRRTIQEAALFDVGFIGKTEYSVTRNVKAAVSYRKGINTIITPTDKYLDRDYLQFQVRCAIFNK